MAHAREATTAAGSPPSSGGDAGTSITKTSLRTGGWLGYDEDALYVARDDRIKLRGEDVTRITLRVVEWDLVVMSLLLVGVGGYVSMTGNTLVGIGFAVVGALSLYRTYRKRYELEIRVEGGKSVTVYPAHPKRCHERLAGHLD
ncbi:MULTISPECIES: hypothetical protein [Saliphagus]|uniref:Uncharacterized protein n=1 Tax=Saliphagus infecundisoli TaxID=1849069 RepID=A0ABD5QLF0_9EURY|nr:MULTISPECIES: hypothetical protein [Saliphagus]